MGSLILRCKGRMAASGTRSLRIQLERAPALLGAVVFSRGDPAVPGLPAQGRDLSAIDLAGL